MLINRVGDFGLALGIMGIYYIFKTVDFSVVFACAAHFAANPAPFVFCNIEFSTLNTICILLFIGAVGKSAQLGLHAWLPDAMEGSNVYLKIGKPPRLTCRQTSTTRVAEACGEPALRRAGPCASACFAAVSVWRAREAISHGC